MGALPPNPHAGFVQALAASPLMRARDSGSATGRPLPARKDGAAADAAVHSVLSPAHGGRRAIGCAREAVKANALLYAFARTERRTRQGKTAAPAGAPREARGSAACGTAALFWVLFWCQKSTAAQLFVLAPQGALLSFEDGTCKDKRQSNAVSHPLRSKRVTARFKQPRQRHSVCPCQRYSAHPRPPMGGGGRLAALVRP